MKNIPCVTDSIGGDRLTLKEYPGTMLDKVDSIINGPRRPMHEEVEILPENKEQAEAKGPSLQELYDHINPGNFAIHFKAIEALVSDQCLADIQLEIMQNGGLEGMSQGRFSYVKGHIEKELNLLYEEE